MAKATSLIKITEKMAYTPDGSRTYRETRLHGSTLEKAESVTTVPQRTADRQFREATSSMPRLKAQSEALLRDIQLRMPQLRKMVESFNIDADGAGIDARGRVGSPTAGLVTRMPDKSSEHVKHGKPVKDGKILATVKESYTPLALPEQTGATARRFEPLLASTGLRPVDAGAQPVKKKGLPVDVRGRFATIITFSYCLVQQLSD